MRQAALDIFVPFTTKFEGALPFMYLDVRGLVTTGIGNLIDIPGSADGWRTTVNMPWQRGSGGSLASKDEIIACWNFVKSRSDLAQRGGVIYGTLPENNLRLSPAAISDLVQSRLTQNETILRGRYPGYDFWPASGQLGLNSMAWAMGAAFNFPKFRAAVNGLIPDFTTAAKECSISSLPKAPPLDDPNNSEKGDPNGRNAANRALFLEAADSIRNGADPEQLFFTLAGVASRTAPAAAKVGAGLVTGGIFGGLAYLAVRMWGKKK